MEFWASSESERRAFENLNRTRQFVEPHINIEIAKVSLAALPCKIRYIPIVMPKDATEKYTARSRLRQKERVYLCAPQLNYDVFVDGTLEEQLREYVRGIEETADHLHKLGATPQQIEVFNAILAGTVDAILAQQDGS